MDARITELAASLENVNRRYKESCEAYDRVKEWYSSEQKKTSELTDNYNRLKEWHESSLEKIELLQQQADRFNTWYGKLAMKCYNFLKKLKRRLTK